MDFSSELLQILSKRTGRFSIVLFLIFSNLAIAKECFKNKQSGELVCYKRYFERDKIYKPKNDETYYTSKSGKLYGIGDKIEVKFKSVGAILSLLDDYEIDFVDKTKGEKYIFKVRNKNELFPMLRILNQLNAVHKALPVATKKHTKEYMGYIRRKREEKLARIKEKMNNPKQQATGKGKSAPLKGSFIDGTIQ